MSGSKKKSRTKTDEAEAVESDSRLFDVLTNILLEQVDNEKLRVDPVEAYVGKLKMRFYSNSEEFYSRFEKGYQVLLEELLKNH